MLPSAEGSYSLGLHWQGPFVWPGIWLKDLPDLLDDERIVTCDSVYLWTVEHAGGYLIYTAGITHRPFGKRFRNIRERTDLGRTLLWIRQNVAIFLQRGKGCKSGIGRGQDGDPD